MDSLATQNSGCFQDSSSPVSPVTSQLFIVTMFLCFQVGACIVNTENKIVGIGYNGMPNGCSDDLLPWRRTAENKLDTKYPYGKVPSDPILLPVVAC
jgi:hypothetical protein